MLNKLNTLNEVVDTVYNHLNVDIDPTSTTKDAFGRIRVSYPQVLGFGSHEYGLNTNFIETKTNGNGLVANLVNESTISLTNGGATSGDYAYAATKAFHRYIPGRSQLVRFTGSFGTPTANVRQRAGYFGDRNGFYLEYDGTSLYFVRRTYTDGSVKNTRIPRSSWSDPMDGTGPSGINLALGSGTTWLCWIDLEWLGVGRYRFGFADPSSGKLVTCYAAAGTNILTVPYMTSACLPVRYEIENTGAASQVTMKWICYAVDTEGGDEGQIPLQYAVDGLTASALANASAGGAFKPLIALRANTVGPNSVPNRGQIILKGCTGLVTGSAPVIFRVIFNPATLTANGGAVTWSTAANLSQYAKFSAANDTVTGGTIVDSFYAAASNQTKTAAETSIFRKFPLVYTELGSIQDTVVLAAAGIGGTSNATGNITFQEQY